MTKPEITEVLHKILVDNSMCYSSEIDDSATLEELSLDSLETIYLVSLIEDKFHVTIDDDLILTTDTLEDIVEKIYELKN